MMLTPEGRRRAGHGSVLGPRVELVNSCGTWITPTRLGPPGPRRPARRGSGGPRKPCPRRARRLPSRTPARSPLVWRASLSCTPPRPSPGGLLPDRWSDGREDRLADGAGDRPPAATRRCRPAAPPDQRRLVKEAHRHLLLRPSTTSRCRSLVTPPLLAEAADEAASAFGTGCGNGAQIASGRFPGLRGGSVPLATPNSRVSSRAAASPGGYRRGQPPGLHGHQHPEPAGVQTAQGAASTPPPPGTVADTGTGTAFPNG
jgi:hypothetical protein